MSSDIGYKPMDKEELEDKGKLLPTPVGYRLLIALPDMEEKTGGGVLVTEDYQKREQKASLCGFVISMGSEAYKDTKKFPDGPWCKVGDWVIFRPYAGTQLKILGREFRLINDDTVEAVVDDPRGVKRG